MNNNPANANVDLSKLSKSTQTENYITLKPLSEKFNRIANSISDDEIRMLIKNSIKEQLSLVNFRYVVQEIIDEWVEEHGEDIIDMYKSNLKERL